MKRSLELQIKLIKKITKIEIEGLDIYLKPLMNPVLYQKLNLNTSCKIYLY